MGHDVQAGDKVAYITKLHEEFLAKNLLESDSMSGPSQLPNVEFRETEPCEVEELHFYIEGTSQVTVLLATLKLLEGTGARSTSNSKHTFQLEIAPPHMGDLSDSFGGVGEVSGAVYGSAGSGIPREVVHDGW